MQTRSGRILGSNVVSKNESVIGKRKKKIQNTSGFVFKKLAVKSKSQCKKIDLILKYHPYLQKIQLIQRWWRYCRTTIFVNDTDFLTMEPFRCRTFHLKDLLSGRIYRFDPINLANYYFQEGNFSNPYTREIISDDDLHRLDKQVSQIDPTFVCLLEHRQSILQEKQLAREHKEMCDYLHAQCFQLITTIDEFAYVTDNSSFTVASFHFEYTALPHFFDSFRQLFIYDSDFACDSIHFIIDEISDKIDNTQCHFQRLLILFIHDKINKFVTDLLPILPALIN